ncbi:MAG: SlyX family protein [Pseudomonas sp.]
MELDSRMADLEARLAFQDDTIQTLNDVLVEQQRAIDLLNAQMGMLARRQADLQSRMGGDEGEAPPPHY